MSGPEVALDELAHELGLDPVELRIRNEPEGDRTAWSTAVRARAEPRPRRVPIASCADVADLQAHWIDEQDPHVNPVGPGASGQIGIVGTAAAIANAAFHATGVRVRDLPLTLDRVLDLTA